MSVLRKKTNSVEVTKSLVCAQTNHYKSDYVTENEKKKISKRYTCLCKSGILFKHNNDIRRYYVSKIENEHYDHPIPEILPPKLTKE